MPREVTAVSAAEKIAEDTRQRKTRIRLFASEIKNSSILM
jgi:hypothetical protein